MLATKLAAAVAVTAALLAGLGGAHLLAGPGDTPVALAAPQAKTPEEPKPQPKTDDAKKPDAKQPDPKTPEPKKEPAAALKARLKKHQDEIAKIRDAMLAEVAAEEKRLDEVIAKAQKEYDEATKNRDFTNASKIFRGLSEARGEKTQVQQLRADIERRIRPVDPPPPPRPPEERLGLRTSPPSSVVVAQLGLKSGEGLVIDSVKADSPAAKLGLQSADILLSVDGKAVPTSAPAFQKLLTELKPGAAVDAVVLRKGKQETIKGFAVPAPQE